MDKAEVRKMMRERKRAVSPEEKLARSRTIMQRLEHTPDFAAARVVLLYWSMSDEVQTHGFVERWYREKTLLLPCVQGDDLVLRQYTGAECMVSGEQFGIGEPAGEEWTDLAAVQLIAVPGVAFDSAGNRMGRGRGFYDRLLKSTPNAVKIGLAYDFQMLDAIPTEPHDVKMDRVLTDVPTETTEDWDK
ncbi:MAG: 5-formyltetrahydrofolate cyclo-ligase [Bacteroidales bacterium]|nr:5-formyltetrahydrofolate cyclo-ligase [Bacteroidales bacterium]